MNFGNALGRNGVHDPAQNDAVLENLLVRDSVEQFLAQNGLDPPLNLSLLSCIAFAQNLGREVKRNVI